MIGSARFRRWRGVAGPFLLLLATRLPAAAPVHGQVAAADVSNVSGSVPRLNPMNTAWLPPDAGQGTPTKNGIRVEYVTDDDAIFPLQSGGGTTVQLRPQTGGMTLNCTLTAIVPVLSSANTGQCFFRVGPSGDVVHIYYMGMLQVGGQIRYTISGLQPAPGAPPGSVVQPFDSNITPAAPAVPMPVAGRPPARLVLVLDRSGSMAWSSHPLDPGCGNFAPVGPMDPCGPSRWQVLGRAVEAFLALARAHHLPGDEIAVAPFSSTVNNAETIGLIQLDNASITASTLVNVTLAPGGGTSIGAGLRKFEPQVAPVAAATRNQTVLLFTDGDQNRAPFVVFNDTQLLINETANSLTGNVTPYASPPPPGDLARVCPFALRSDNPGNPLGTVFNQDIASRRCNGIVLTAVSVDPAEPELIQYFAQILNATLIGDKLEVASVRSGTASVVGPAAAPDTVFTVHEPFVISRRDVAFTLLFTWPGESTGIADLVLEKDGSRFHVLRQGGEALVDRGRAHLAVTLRLPYVDSAGGVVTHEGEWTAHVRPYSRTDTTFRYNLFVIPDNETIATEFEALQPTPGVGRPIELRVRITEAGAPVTGLPAGSVTAIVSRPQLGLGNVLSTAKVAPVAGPSLDSIGAAGRKAAAMLADPALRAQLLAALVSGAAQEVELAETAPGVYGATFTQTGAEGTYPVRFLVEGSTAGNGPLARAFTLTRYVPVVADAQATEASLSVTSTECGLPGGCYSVTVTPKDAAGNLAGPGKAGLITVTGFDGVVLGPVRDNLDGSYTVDVGYPAGANRQPTINFYGVDIHPRIPGKGGVGAAGGRAEWEIFGSHTALDDAVGVDDALGIGIRFAAPLAAGLRFELEGATTLPELGDDSVRVSQLFAGVRLQQALMPSLVASVSAGGGVMHFQDGASQTAGAGHASAALTLYPLRRLGIRGTGRVLYVADVRGAGGSTTGTQFTLGLVFRP